MSTVAITGATGLVGGALCNAFAQRGWSVRRLSRVRQQQVVGEWFRCELDGTIDQEAFAGCEVVIHAAYAMRTVTNDAAQRVNEEGTRRILAMARASGPRFVFISSFSAHEAARSYYGQSKLAIEKTLDPVRDLVIRPGLVLAPSGGVFGAMVAQVRRHRLIPLVGGGDQPLQTIHIDDLCTGVVAAVERKLTGRLLLAERSPVAMRRFLELLSRRLGRQPVFVPIPAWPVLVAARILEAFGIRPPISSENIRGLLALRSADCQADLAKLSLEPRSTEQSLHDLPL